MGWVFPGFSLLCVYGTVSKTVTVIAGFDDVAMVGEAVEQRGGHLRVVEDPGPFTEGKVGGEDHAGALVEFAQQVEQQGAARSVLAGQSTATPKAADGAVEMMRQIKIARDTAVKPRTTAMITLKQIVVNAPPGLREALQELPDHGLLTRCAGLRPGPLDTPTASAKHTLRALARRWIALAEEIASTTATSRDSRPKRRPPSGRASESAPTLRPRC